MNRTSPNSPLLPGLNSARSEGRGPERPGSLPRFEDLLLAVEGAVLALEQRATAAEAKGQALAPAGLSRKIQELRDRAESAGVRYRKARQMPATISALAEELRFTRKILKSHRFITFKNYASAIGLLAALAKRNGLPVATTKPSTCEAGEASGYLLVELTEGQVSFGVTKGLLSDLVARGVPTEGLWDGHSITVKDERIMAALDATMPRP